MTIATLFRITSHLHTMFLGFTDSTTCAILFLYIETSMDVMASITLLNGHSFKLLPTTKSTPI